MGRYAIVAAVLVVSGSISEAVAEEPQTLKVISYNVQFLPGVAAGSNKRPEPEYRAGRIGEAMAVFDIVTLQETFNEKHRPLIVEALKKAWGGAGNEVVAPKPSGFLANGGTMIMAKLPIAESGSIVYKNYSLPKDYGLRADGFAAKGCIHGRVTLGVDREVDVFVTHLEARAGELRPLQYQELSAFVQSVNKGERPALLLGDLNTNGNPEERAKADSQYSVMMKTLNSERGESPFVDVWPLLMKDALGGTNEQESSDTGERIDYVLVSNPGGGAPGLEATGIRVNPYPDVKTEYLSDHSAVEAEFEWGAM